MTGYLHSDSGIAVPEDTIFYSFASTVAIVTIAGDF